MSWIGAWLIAALTIPMGILLPADLAILIFPLLIGPLACLIDYYSAASTSPSTSVHSFPFEAEAEAAIGSRRGPRTHGRRRLDHVRAVGRGP